MADKKIKKILIFACPRTGTTIIQKIISIDLFGIPNLVEPFNDPALGFNPGNPKMHDGKPVDLYQWVEQQQTGAMKLLAINLDYVDVDKLLLVGNYDRTVIVERKNLVDCCVSLHLAQYTKKYHYTEMDTIKIDPFECDMTSVDQWIQMYKTYQIALDKIKKSSTPYDIICYEDFMDDKVQYIAGFGLQLSRMTPKVFGNREKMIATNFPYKELCVNYKEVEEKIRNELCLQSTKYSAGT